MKLKLFLVNQITREGRWLQLPIVETWKLEELLPEEERFLIHRFETKLPNFKLSMVEDIVHLNNLLLKFSSFTEEQKKTVLALCEKGYKFQESVEESNRYKLSEGIKTISDYGLHILREEVKMSSKMITSMNLEEYGFSILKLDKKVLFSSYGLLRKEK